MRVPFPVVRCLWILYCARLYDSMCDVAVLVPGSRITYLLTGLSCIVLRDEEQKVYCCVVK